MVATALLLTKTNKYSTQQWKPSSVKGASKNGKIAPSLKTIVMGLAFHFTAICWTTRIIKTQLWQLVLCVVWEATDACQRSKWKGHWGSSALPTPTAFTIQTVSISKPNYPVTWKTHFQCQGGRIKTVLPLQILRTIQNTENTKT